MVAFLAVNEVVNTLLKALYNNIMEAAEAMVLGNFGGFLVQHFLHQFRFGQPRSDSRKVSLYKVIVGSAAHYLTEDMK